MAAVIQFTGATLFSISTILGVPGVLPPESSTYFAVWDATFWTLQVGGFQHMPLEIPTDKQSTNTVGITAVHEYAAFPHDLIIL